MTDQQAITVVGQSIMPAMNIAQAVERRKMLHDYIASQMTEGIDYGALPGMEERKDPSTGEIILPKKVLLKPGAEKLSTLFALHPRFSDIAIVEDWTGKDHGEVFFYYRQKCSLYRGDEFMGDADGSCNSMEKKYRYRQAKRICPNCGKAAIIKGKDDYGGGWLCWKKNNGCGMKFSDGDTTIENQEVGQIPNPDIADQANTILKQAQKRAFVAIVLISVNASDYFTQDIEEEEDPKTSAKVEIKSTEPLKTTSTLYPEQPKPDKTTPNTVTVRPYEPDNVKQRISEKAASYAQEGKKASEQFRGLVCGMVEQCFDPEDAETKKKKRHSILQFLIGKDSAKDIPDWYFYALRDWLNWKQDSGGLYILDPLSIKEAHRIIEKVLLDAGQQTF
jgi:hypothetical protein